MRRRAHRTETARVHLDLLDESHTLAFPVRVGPVALVDLVPIARELTTRLVALVDEDARARGEPPTCRKGCDACCHHLIPISPVEALWLARVVAKLPAARRDAVRARFASAVRAMQDAGLVDRDAGPEARIALRSAAEPGRAAWEDVSRRHFDARIPCPFLEDGACGIYADRPMVCRTYSVHTPPERCASLDGGAEALPRPFDIGEALVDAANELAGLELPSIPLPLALSWAEAASARFEGVYDGETLFHSLLAHVAPDAPGS
jgi:Fe-S-cluster containining protein